MPDDLDCIASEIARLRGVTPGSVRVEGLRHNPANAVTASIARVTADDWSAVVKVLRRDDVDAPAHWVASDVPSAWNYWKREALVYEEGLGARCARGGLEAPRLLGIVERSEDEVALWLEDVAGTPGAAWDVDRYATLGRSLGVTQAELARDEDLRATPWLSRGFLRDYSTSRPADWSLLDDDTAWAQPLVRECFPPGLRRDVVRMHAERDRWLDLLQALPRTVCHLDVWPLNLIASDDARTVLLDWSFLGDGAIGEDVGNLIPDCVFDLLLPASDLHALDEAVFAAYLDGLRLGGWDGDDRLVRLGVCASAIKYDWLTPLMLERAAQEEQPDYGGEAVVEAELRYAERGTALAFLTRWLDEARVLASDLGR